MFKDKLNPIYYRWLQPANHEQDTSKDRPCEDTIDQLYAAVVKGWTRALELRDPETSAHSQRVTEFTLRLARHFYDDEQVLRNIYYGALLHDVGKLGLPDRIIQKTGALSAEEWVLVRKHPIYAFEMLQAVSYLQPAVDIPYCHHEKWDGTGYPRGLQGEEIPFPARIFAVVDVWDALGSDRPYRKAWPTDDKCNYLRDQSGRHFDPVVVSVFLSMI